MLYLYTGSGKSLAQPTSRCILFDSENISFDSSLFIYINSTNISPIIIINRVYENSDLLYIVYFVVGLRTYQRPCTCVDIILNHSRSYTNVYFSRNHN